MADGKEYSVTIVLRDGRTLDFDNVKATGIDDGCVWIALPDEELESNRIRHCRIEYPLDMVEGVKRTYTCSIADHKATEARYSTLADLQKAGLSLITGFASASEEEGDDAS